MKVTGYLRIKRHDAPRNDGRAVTWAPGGSLLVVDGFDMKQLTAVNGSGTNGDCDGAPSSPLPETHPLSIRYRQNRVHLVDELSWRQTIPVGGTELAVA